MRLLVVSDVEPVPSAGGASRVLVAHATGLGARGHEVRILCRRAASGSLPAGLPGGVAVEAFEVDRRDPWRFYRSAVENARLACDRLAAEAPPDLVLLHQPFSAAGALRSRLARVSPSLYTFHSPAAEEFVIRAPERMPWLPGLAAHGVARMLHRLEREALHGADRVAALSEFSRGLLGRLHGIDPARVRLVPGGVDLDRFRPPEDRRAVRRTLALPEQGPLLFTVRNLTARMGLDRLLHAMAEVRAKVPEARLVIGGDGPLRSRLERLARDLGLDGTVTLIGRVPEATLHAYYQAADLFVLPTAAYEGFGLVTIEALACGTPVLGTPVGATPEILGPLDRRLLLDGTGASSLAAGLVQWCRALAADPEGHEALRRACRAHAERYSWERAVAALEAEIEGLERAARRRPASRCPACDAPGDWRPAFRQRNVAYRRCRRCGLAEREGAVGGAAQDGSRPRPVTPPSGGDRTPVYRGVLRLAAAAPGRRLLDVGCGDGALLAAARASGWDAIGVEPSAEAVALARRRAGAPVLHGTLEESELEAASFDAVVMVDVLDLVTDPGREVALAWRLLRPDGVLVCRVRNGRLHGAVSRLACGLGPLPGARWLGRLPVLHRYGFSPAALAALLHAAGFDAVRLEPSPVTRSGGRARAWAVRALAALGGRGLGPSLMVVARRPAPVAGGVRVPVAVPAGAGR